MSGFQQQYSLWDEFLSLWATSRLATITLDEYRSAGSKNSFKRKSKAVLDASVCFLSIKSRLVINTLDEQFWFFLLPLLEHSDRGEML